MAWVAEDLGRTSQFKGWQELGLPDRTAAAQDLRRVAWGPNDMTSLHAAVIHLEDNSMQPDKMPEGWRGAAHIGTAALGTALRGAGGMMKRVAPALNAAGAMFILPGELARQRRAEKDAPLVHAATEYVKVNYSTELHDERLLAPFLRLSLLFRLIDHYKAQYQAPFAVSDEALVRMAFKFCASCRVASPLRGSERGLLGLEKLYEPLAYVERELSFAKQHGGFDDEVRRSRLMARFAKDVTDAVWKYENA